MAGDHRAALPPPADAPAAPLSGAAGAVGGPVLVVVSHYDARPPGRLVALLDAMRAVPAGWPFDPRVVVNQEAGRALELPDRHGAVGVFYRGNVGYNIGAWEEGWRQPPAYGAYLFLQEECRVARPGWVAAFARAAADPAVGLLGECLSPDWDATWAELERRFGGEVLPGHLVDGRPAGRVACYRHFLARRGIPAGERGDHLQSLVLFARRGVLEAVGGLPVGADYGEAIAAEIGISKKVQALGLRVAQVAPEPFAYVEHPQWLHRRGAARRP